MHRRTILAPVLFFALVISSCSPRDFLTRRLAADLIAGSRTFNAPQRFALQTGIVSNKLYFSPEYLALQHRGWISATTAGCTPDLAPPPCWDVTLTPSGVDTIHVLVDPADAAKKSFNISAARRELAAITGISKQGITADVDFTWKWFPLNEVGAAIFPADTLYRSSVGFRSYDDGWRIVDSAFHSGQSLDDALKNAEPVR